MSGSTVCQADSIPAQDDDGKGSLIEVLTEPIKTKKSPIDYASYMPYFLQTPLDKIKKTFEVTTQHATNVLAGEKIIQTNKAANPAFNVWRRNEPVAADTIYTQRPSYDSGYTMTQIFVGRNHW